MSVTKKYGDFIGIGMLVLIGLFLAAVYFEFLDIGWEQSGSLPVWLVSLLALSSVRTTRVGTRFR